MAKKYKRYFMISICLLITGRLLLLLVNYAVDPFDVLQSNFLHRSGATNQRFAKVEYLINNKGKYNSYIFGNSCAGVVDPDLVERYMPGANFYNLSLNSGTIYEYSLILHTLLKEGIPVSNVLLMLNVDYMTNKWLRDYDEPPYKRSYEFRLHPVMLKNIDRWEYYFDYLKRFNLGAIIHKLRKNVYYKDSKLDIDIVNNGMLHWISKESRIIEDPDGHTIEIDRLAKDTSERNLKIKRFKIIEEIIDFKKICKANNINPTIILNPINYNMLNQINKADYLSFLFDLSQKTDYWNFSGYNSIALDNRNFYDLSHFRPYVADFMIQKMFKDHNGLDDFGFYVTRDNINIHIQYIQTLYSQFN